jgi:hypothetical protein
VASAPFLARFTDWRGNRRKHGTRASLSAIWGSSSLIKVVDCTNQSKSGDGLMKRNIFALFGVVAVLLTATVALTVSRATLSAGGVGSLKCYDIGGIEKAC